MQRHFIFLTLLICVPSNDLSAQTSTQYLQSTSDRFQHTVDVYTVADAAGNHFAARGELDSNGGLLVQVPTMDEISTNAPCSNLTCITATYNPNDNAWGGWYFLNGILGSTDRVPQSNWGATPDAGFDLTGVTTLQFWARGKAGGEKIQFFAFGVGRTNPPYAPFPDSAAKLSPLVTPTTLTTTWTQYQIPLVGLDLHYTLGGFGWVATKADQATSSSPVVFYLKDIQYLKDQPTAPRLLVSYETIPSTIAFDTVLRNTAFTYDNAVALIALAASGDTLRAQYTADALLYAQANDRFFTDNRVRNAYQGGDIALPPGWLPNNKQYTVRMPGWYDPSHSTWYEDATQVSTNTGNVAWTMIADLYLYDLTKQQKYLTAAQQLGDWVRLNTQAAIGTGFTGGFDGWENQAASGTALNCASGEIVNGQCKRHYKATEHNIDLYSAFSHLYKIDESPRWAAAALQAKAFFLSMWDPSEGKFWTGTIEDEVTPSKTVVPLDIQVWALESLGTESQSFLSSLSYIELNHKTAYGYGFKQNGGNGDCVDGTSDSTWFEGTSQVALAYKLNNNPQKAQQILYAIHAHQNQTGSINATDGSCLNTGFNLNDGSPWLYFPRAHVGATAWLSIAENGTNPFRGELYSPVVSASSVTFSNQNIGTNSAPSLITVENRGVAPFSIAAPTFSGISSNDFLVLSNGCATGVQVGATCTISVAFNPVQLGTRSATLSIVEKAGDLLPALSLPPIQLTGTGCEVVSGILRHSPAFPVAYAGYLMLPSAFLVLMRRTRIRRRSMLWVGLALAILCFCLLAISCQGGGHLGTTSAMQKCS